MSHNTISSPTQTSTISAAHQEDIAKLYNALDVKMDFMNAEMSMFLTNYENICENFEAITKKSKIISQLFQKEYPPKKN